MEISFQGFHWDCQSPKFDLPQFLTCCQKYMNGKEHRKRLTYFVKNGTLWNGLVLTIKDMRRFVTLKESGQVVTLDPHELGSDERLADFNFFVFDDKTCFRLYQHYHHSCSLNTFNGIAKYYYHGFRKKYFDKAKDDCEAKGLSKAKTKQVTDEYRGTFTPSIVKKKGDFIERISHMKDAYSADIEFITLDYLEDDFKPIKPYLKNVKYRLSFEKEKKGLGKIKGLASILKSHDLKKATVTGIDENGYDVVYKLFNDFDKFKTYDYEDMVPSLNLDTSKVNDSILNNKIVHELNSVYKKVSSSLKSRK